MWICRAASLWALGAAAPAWSPVRSPAQVRSWGRIAAPAARREPERLLRGPGGEGHQRGAARAGGADARGLPLARARIARSACAGDARACGAHREGRRAYTFAYKDPRFCYTLGAWRPALPREVAFVCVFREPARTVNSTLRERREAPWLRDVRLGYDDVLSLWTLMYRHVLDMHAREGDWLFVHYEQVLDGPGLLALERHLDAPLDRAFPARDLQRSSDCGRVDVAASHTYAELCARASFRTALR